MDVATVDADMIVRIAERIADRFRGGGRLFVDGHGRGVADANHVVVEFMHPVTVGRRSLPAFQGLQGSLPGDVTMLIAYGGAAAASTAGDVDIAITDLGGGTGSGTLILSLPPDVGRAKVAAVLGYHVVWELVHVFLEHGSGSSIGDPAASSLYPMLYQTADDGAGIDALRKGALHSAEMKIASSAEVCAEALAANAGRIDRVADIIAGAGSVFTFGNGGSSTDAADAAVAFGTGSRSLAADVATMSALANDVGFDVVFARQLATVGGPGDCMVAFSTSGNSTNLIEGARAAKRVGMATIGLAGFDGGAMASADVFDVVIVVGSDSVHRIQEAHSAIIAAIAERVAA